MSLNNYLQTLARESRPLYECQKEARARTRRVVERELSALLKHLLTLQPRVDHIFQTSSPSGQNLDLISSSVLRVTHGVYIWRLYLKEPRDNQVIQMLTGFPHEIPAGQAVLSLNTNIPMCDRNWLKRQYTDSINPEHYFDPRQINNWLCPALKKAIDSLRNNEKRSTTLRHQCQKNNFFIFIDTDTEIADGIRCKSTTKIIVQMAARFYNFPKGFILRTPYPKGEQFKPKAKVLRKQILDELAEKKLWFEVFTSVEKPAGCNKQGSEQTRKPKSFSAPSKFPNKPKTVKIKASDKYLLWTIESKVIENEMIFALQKDQAFRLLWNAFRVYNVVANCGKHMVPLLSDDIKRAASLGLFHSKYQEMKSHKSAFNILLGHIIECFGEKNCKGFLINRNVWSFTPKVRQSEFLKLISKNKDEEVKKDDQATEEQQIKKEEQIKDEQMKKEQVNDGEIQEKLVKDQEIKTSTDVTEAQNEVTENGSRKTANGQLDQKPIAVTTRNDQSDEITHVHKNDGERKRKKVQNVTKTTNDKTHSVVRQQHKTNGHSNGSEVGHTEQQAERNHVRKNTRNVHPDPGSASSSGEAHVTDLKLDDSIKIHSDGPHTAIDDPLGEDCFSTTTASDDGVTKSENGQKEVEDSNDQSSPSSKEANTTSPDAENATTDEKIDKEALAGHSRTNLGSTEADVPDKTDKSETKQPAMKTSNTGNPPNKKRSTKTNYKQEMNNLKKIKPFLKNPKTQSKDKFCNLFGLQN